MDVGQNKSNKNNNVDTNICSTILFLLNTIMIYTQIGPQVQQNYFFLKLFVNNQESGRFIYLWGKRPPLSEATAKITHPLIFTLIPQKGRKILNKSFLPSHLFRLKFICKKKIRAPYPNEIHFKIVQYISWNYCQVCLFSSLISFNSSGLGRDGCAC